MDNAPGCRRRLHFSCDLRDGENLRKEQALEGTAGTKAPKVGTSIEHWWGRGGMERREMTEAGREQGVRERILPPWKGVRVSF